MYVCKPIIHSSNQQRTIPSDLELVIFIHSSVYLLLILCNIMYSCLCLDPYINKLVVRNQFDMTDMFVCINICIMMIYI